MHSQLFLSKILQKQHAEHLYVDNLHEEKQHAEHLFVDNLHEEKAPAFLLQVCNW